MASAQAEIPIEQVESSRSGNRSRRGGRGGGGGRPQPREMIVSKALSKLLRHDAEKCGLKLDGKGYANVADVLRNPRIKSLGTTWEEITHAVNDNAKQRFAMRPIDSSTPSDSGDPSLFIIRANQGHSIPLDSAALLTPITLESGIVPDQVIHGTYYAFYPAIVSSGGLKKMSRNHIHFSTGLPEDTEAKVISGMRNDAEILIYIDIRKSLEDGGIKWWLSDNGVVLSEGNAEGVVPTKYWKLVKGRRQDVGVLWEDGKEVAELPQSVRNRKAPSGKGPRGNRESEKPKGKGKSHGGNRLKEVEAVGGSSQVGHIQE